MTSAVEWLQANNRKLKNALAAEQERVKELEQDKTIRDQRIAELARSRSVHGRIVFDKIRWGPSSSRRACSAPDGLRPVRAGEPPRRRGPGQRRRPSPALGPPGLEPVRPPLLPG